MKRFGQATLEQVLLIVTIIVVAVAMRATLRRAMGGYWRSASATMGGTPYAYGERNGTTTGTTTLRVRSSQTDVFKGAMQRDHSGAPRLTSEGKRGFSTTATSTTHQEITVAEHADVLQPLR